MSELIAEPENEPAGESLTPNERHQFRQLAGNRGLVIEHVIKHLSTDRDSVGSVGCFRHDPVSDAKSQKRRNALTSTYTTTNRTFKIGERDRRVGTSDIRQIRFDSPTKCQSQGGDGGSDSSRSHRRSKPREARHGGGQDFLDSVVRSKTRPKRENSPRGSGGGVGVIANQDTRDLPWPEFLVRGFREKRFLGRVRVDRLAS